MKQHQRIISGFLALCMVFSMLPMQVVATEAEPAVETIVAETVPEETVSETTVPTEVPSAPTEAEPEPTEESTIPSETVTKPTVEPVAPIVETVESRVSEEAMNADTTASGTCGENLTWTLDSEGVLTISGTGPMASYGDMGYGQPWDYMDVSSIVIEEGVTSIGSFCFWYLDAVSITIPSTLTSIGSDAFGGCGGILTDVYISDFEAWSNINFGGFGKYSRGTPFNYASNLYLNGELVTEYTFPEGTTTIRNMFYGVKCLTKVTIPDGVTKIDNSAFANCTGLTNIELPETVTQIGEMAFSGCSGLNSMTLPKNVKSIGNYAFSGCSALTSFEIPEGITTIGMDTFSACSNLASITIPKSVTSIAEYAFWGSNNLKDIYYGGSQATWANVKNHTGSYNGSLTSATVHFAEANEPCGDDLLWEYDEANHILTIRGTGPMYNYTEQSRPPWDALIYLDVKQIIVEEGVTTIGDYAFEGAWTPAKASLPESLVSIGAYAFQDCFYLKEISIPDSVTEIKDYAFHACGFTKISLPSKLQKIGSYVFYSCDALTEVIIPDTLTFLGEGMFAYCSALPAINIPEGISSIPDSFCSDCENLTAVTIPSTVVTIDSGAFSRCSKLNSINIPEGVSGISYSAFSSCTKLKSVALPSTLQTIGPSAFSYCTLLAEIVIPDGVTSIGSSAFRSCSNLTNVSIPSSVTSIGASAFSYCEKLTSITLPKSVTVIANNTFGNCNALTDVYYTGTEEQWAELLASTDPEYNAPLFNEELQVHCNWITESEESIAKRSVRYYSDWSKTYGIAYFGTDYSVECIVSEETDTAFTENPIQYIEQYVLVETKMEDDNEILLSMNPVGSYTGTVESVNSDEITIDGMVYKVPEFISDPYQYLNQFVLYHEFNENLVGIECLQTREGHLTYYWKTPEEAVAIKQSADSGSKKEYRLSNNVAVIGWLNEPGSMALDITYIVDSNDFIYDISPKKIEGGFFNKTDGWSFANIWDAFGYEQGNYSISAERYEEVFGKSFAAVARMGDDVVSTLIPQWGGNCFGMAATAVLYYLDMLQWNHTETVNAYNTGICRDASARIYATSDMGSDITNLIERYQILQDSVTEYDKVDSTFEYIDTEYCNLKLINREHLPNGKYIQRVYDTICEAKEPLLMSMYYNGGAHTVVVRTDVKPIKMTDGWIRVYIYDPNRPYLSPEFIPEGEVPAYYYQTDYDECSYVDLNVEKNVWRYLGSSNSIAGEAWRGSDENGTVLMFKANKGKAPEYMYVWSIGNSGIPTDFNGTEQWNRASAGTSDVLYSSDMTAQVCTTDGTLLCEIENGQIINYSDEVTFGRTDSMMAEESSTCGGSMSIPYTDFTVKYTKGHDVTIMTLESVITLASTGSATLQISAESGKIQIQGDEKTEVGVQITDVYSNSEYTSVCGDGMLNAGDTVTLQMMNDTFSGDFVGSGSLELTTDNEDAPESRIIGTLQNENQNVEIEDVRKEKPEGHIHNNDTIIPAQDATCIENGLTEGKKCSICGEITVEQTAIPATGDHVYDQEIADDKYLVSEATFTSLAVYHKSCKCGAEGEETFTAGALKAPEFKDVLEDAYYYDPVMWAVGKGVTNGYGEADTFAPDIDCTRGQIVTFLWRAAGSPEPASSVMSFDDVAESDFYYKAVLWAVENGITNGYGGADTFAPDVTCTRGQVVTMLNRYLGGKTASDNNPFMDVEKDTFYYDAVLWAVENGITTGTSATTFEPDATCTRGQIVTFLYRALNK